MFSSRLPAGLSPNALTLLLQSMRAQGVPILDLTESNPTRAHLDYPVDEILSAISDPAALRYDPDPAGLRSAREAVASYYGGIGADRILLTCGTSEAYSYLFKLLCDPGDEVLVPRPSYPLFDYLASLESVALKPYPRLDGIEACITSRTRAIVVVNPNNPTGAFLKRAELARLEALCAERSLALLSDEVFADYAFAPDPDRAPTIVPLKDALGFAMSGLSKVAALPQLKLGWIVVTGPGGLCRQSFERLEWIADTYLSVGTPVQLAAPKLLALRRQIQDSLRARIAANLAELRWRVTADSPFRVLDVEGGWYATLEVPRIRTEEEWTLDLLREDHVLVQPGYFYDFEREAFLVLSLLTSPETFSEGVRRLCQRT